MTTEAAGGGRRKRSLWKGPALAGALAVTALLLASLIVDGWYWHPGGFLVVGVLVGGARRVFEGATRHMDAIAYRMAVGIALAATFFVVWESVVQRLDLNPDAAMSFGVPIVGLVGAAVARLRPKGMALALFVTAGAEAAVWVAAQVRMHTRRPDVATWTGSEWRGLGASAFCTLLFVGSALLFWRAGRRESLAGPAEAVAAPPASWAPQGMTDLLEEAS